MTTKMETIKETYFEERALQQKCRDLKSEISNRKAEILKACKDGEFDSVPRLTVKWQEAVDELRLTSDYAKKKRHDMLNMGVSMNQIQSIALNL